MGPGHSVLWLLSAPLDHCGVSRDVAGGLLLSGYSLPSWGHWGAQYNGLRTPRGSMEVTQRHFNCPPRCFTPAQSTELKPPACAHADCSCRAVPWVSVHRDDTEQRTTCRSAHRLHLLRMSISPGLCHLESAASGQTTPAKSVPAAHVGTR